MIKITQIRKFVYVSVFGLLAMSVCSCNSVQKPQAESTEATTPAQGENINESDSKSLKPEKKMSKLEHLTVETFKEKVFNFEASKDWKFEGDKPCIIDFYADWCQPCKMIAPILEELQEEYDGEINIYKVNTEEQQELASAFGIRSIPSLLFCPMEGEPQMAQGALPKQTFKQAINDVLLKKADTSK